MSDTTSITSGDAGNAQDRLEMIAKRMHKAAGRFNRDAERPTLVAVSKTFEAEAIKPVLEAGQRHFGENRVQEAKAKWPDLRARYPGVVLHLIGPLQTNKVKDAVALFDVIETVDRDKLAKALGAEMRAQARRLPCFVQVNIGGEDQKSGVPISDTAAFIDRCRSAYDLDIVGLMCIPPADHAPGPYFARLAQLAHDSGLYQLSMGMSADYETAIEMGATQVRVGSALFGGR